MKDISLDTIIKVATLIGIPSIFLLLNYVFKGIGLAQVTPFERHLMQDSKKLLSSFLDAVYPALLFGIASVIILEFADEASSFSSNLLFGGLEFIVLLVAMVFINVKFGGKERYYITEAGEKIYIHKITGEGEVILSKEKILTKYSVYMLQKKEFLYGKEIRVEHVDT